MELLFDMPRLPFELKFVSAATEFEQLRFEFADVEVLCEGEHTAIWIRKRSDFENHTRSGQPLSD